VPGARQEWKTQSRLEQPVLAGEGVRLVFVASVDWFFLLHFLPIARAARKAGCEIWVAAANTGRQGEFAEEGLNFAPIPVQRKSINPLVELRSLGSLVRLYKGVRPTLVFHVALKPVVYGSIAACVTGRPAIVNAVTGLGFAFSRGKGAWIRRSILRPLLWLTLHLHRSRTIFHNPDDLARCISMGLVPGNRAVLIRGAGVDCSLFVPSAPPSGRPIVMLAGRMLWDKGVGEFVDAARILRAAGQESRFVLVGGLDPDNMAGIPVGVLREWQETGVVEWWGHAEDMPRVLAQASVVVLPSYHEGLPRVLLEAAAAGKPIVTTDIPGCREVVRDGVNGYLVPPRNPEALAAAVNRLLESRDLRARFGAAGRGIAVQEFAEEIVVKQTLDVFRELLGECWPGSR
jgi:glycosyltransferase involved in cell wall biosynthesis